MKAVEMSEVIFTKEISRPPHHCQFRDRAVSHLKISVDFSWVYRRESGDVEEHNSETQTRPLKLLLRFHYICF